MFKYYYLFEQIFKNKNAKLKDLFNIFHKVIITLSLIPPNFIINSNILSIFSIQLTNIFDIGVNIYLIIFKNILFYH